MQQAGETEIREFDLDYETDDGLECEYEYELKSFGRETGEIETTTAEGRKDKRKDDATLAEVKRVLEAMALSPDLDREELIERACNALALDRSRLRKLEVEVAFKDGRQIGAKLQ